MRCSRYLHQEVNSTKAAGDSSFEPSPSLSIAIYDPSLNLVDALNKSYTRLIDINALGTTSINLGITSRQALNEDPVYDYNLQISSVPARNLVCNVMDNTSYPCVSIIRLSFPTFIRTNIKEQRVMGWQVCTRPSASGYMEKYIIDLTADFFRTFMQLSVLITLSFSFSAGLSQVRFGLYDEKMTRGSRIWGGLNCRTDHHFNVRTGISRTMCA